MKDLHYHSISDHNVIELNFVDMGIGDEEIIPIAEALKTNTNIKKIDLSINKISHLGVKTLAESFKINSTITALDLSSNNISPEGAQFLAEMLKTNTTLFDLNLNSCNMEDQGTEYIALALQTNTNLRKLDLSSNNISPEGAQSLAEMLKTNTTLSDLHLADNEIEDNGTKALADGISHNTTLNTLDLADNDVGSVGAKALAAALTHNTSITTLILSDNKIGHIGAEAFARILKTNNHLASLTIWGNNIGCGGAEFLADALKNNISLTHLDLMHNNIGDPGIQALMALQENSTLSTIDISQNNIGSEGETLSEMIHNIIARNHRSFYNKYHAVMNGEFKKFSLYDIQTFIPILNVYIHNHDQNHHIICEDNFALAITNNTIARNSICFRMNNMNTNEGFSKFLLHKMQTFIPILDSYIHEQNQDIGLQKKEEVLNIIHSIITMSNTCFPQGDPVRNEECTNFSLQDVQIFIPILHTYIHDRYIEVKRRIMNYFHDNLLHVLGIDDAIPLPEELKVHIASFLIPKDLNLTTKIVITNNDVSAPASFVDMYTTQDVGHSRV